MTDKAATLRELDEAWAALRSLVDSLAEQELAAPGVVDAWSVKDLLGHMAFWAQKAADDLRLLTDGRESEIQTPGSEQGVDEWNARESERRKGLDLAAVTAEWQRGHEAARRALEAVAPERLDVEVKGWSMARRFGEDTYVHYREHADQIRAWQRQRETSET
ncbi:MAG: maleylpyruvate isomerase N-terminal domain-containing protein [Dehalococcoidia bacterium]|nr:maleylpyruvate isomerase N-terminal domain-containing protein [Dehalococcoidia bacterium]